MNAAVLHEHGAAPRYGPFEDPQPQPGAVVVEVAAAGLHHLDLLKASGNFYMGPPPLPSAVGTDGVGRVPGGRRVYFDDTVAPYGSMAERALANEDALFDIDDGLDDVTAAALGNTGLGAWLAVTWRSGMEQGDTVLVLGCGAFGSLAVQIAKLRGAGRVVAADRGGERLERLRERGADAVVALDERGRPRRRLPHRRGRRPRRHDRHPLGRSRRRRDPGRRPVRPPCAGRPRRRAHDHAAGARPALGLAGPARVPRRPPAGPISAARDSSTSRATSRRATSPSSSRRCR